MNCWFTRHTGGGGQRCHTTASHHMDMEQRRLQALLTVQAGANMNWSMTSLVAMAGGEVEACGITFCNKLKGQECLSHPLPTVPTPHAMQRQRHAPVGTPAANLSNQQAARLPMPPSCRPSVGSVSPHPAAGSTRGQEFP